MFLISVDHDQTWDRIAREIANHAIALIEGETRSAAITRHRHPAGIDDDPAFVMLMADHSCQHRESYVPDIADADPCHHQIEEHENPGTHLGDAGEVAGKMRGRSGSHTHLWTR